MSAKLAFPKPDKLIVINRYVSYFMILYVSEYRPILDFFSLFTRTRVRYQLANLVK